jgi:hypothetical protein
LRLRVSLVVVVAAVCVCVCSSSSVVPSGPSSLLPARSLASSVEFFVVVPPPRSPVCRVISFDSNEEKSATKSAVRNQLQQQKLI